MFMDMLEDIRDVSQSHPNVNKREAHYKIRNCINKKQPEWRGALKVMQNRGKDLHNLFQTVVKEISQNLSP